MSEKLIDYSEKSVEELSRIYESVCNEYASRLCSMYGWYFEDCWWVSDRPGEVFCSSGMEYSLGMDDIKYLVDNGVPYDDFSEWWNYNMVMSYAHEMEPDNNDFHQINLDSWFRGCPRHDKETVENLEKRYWNGFRRDIDK